MNTQSAPSDHVRDKQRENAGSISPALAILAWACVGAFIWEVSGLRGLVMGFIRSVFA